MFLNNFSKFFKILKKQRRLKNVRNSKHSIKMEEKKKEK